MVNTALTLPYGAVPNHESSSLTMSYCHRQYIVQSGICSGDVTTDNPVMGLVLN